MGQKDGFLKFKRETPKERKPEDRIKDYKEIYRGFSEEKIRRQAARCMDCGIPFCHNGCPLGNIIPDFNDAVYNGDWQLAIELLKDTNNFPEFTGRICPAPCEGSCVLGINKPQVTIELIEKLIVETAYEKGLIKPEPPQVRTGKTVAVVGSGPAGLAAADQLNKAGHLVTVFERDDRLGGLLRYGIPDFKLEKWVIDRRTAIMEEEGVTFKLNANVGENVNPQELINRYDAVVLCGGSTIPRDLNIPGRDLKGVHFAMEFLTQQNKRVAGDTFSENETLSASGKNIVVIGGGDTGSDCVGTSNRHEAKSITQLELLPKPPEDRTMTNPWPEWPQILRTSSSHNEGCERYWSVLTEEFIGDEDGNLKALRLTDIEWYDDNGRKAFKKQEGTTREIPCEMVFLAMGFVHPQKEGMLTALGVELDQYGNVSTKGYATSVDKVFAAGDMRRGQSLVVWAISEGREAARQADEFLTGKQSMLKSKNNTLVGM